jgi:hypothetical protein
MPNTWTEDSKNISLQSYFSILKFLKKNDIFTSNEKCNNRDYPEKSPYHQSLIYFLLYYAYYPKIPFIIQYNNHLVFGSIYGRNHTNLELSFPLLQDSQSILDILHQLMHDLSFKTILEEANISQILLRDAPDEFIQNYRSLNIKNEFEISSIKEINYQTYKITRSLHLKGKEFANLRWHINKFKKDNHTIESVFLSGYEKAVIHLIGAWKKNAVAKRGFSYINVRSDKQAVRLFSSSEKIKNKKSKKNPVISDCIIRVLKIDGHIKSFHLGYPLGIFSKKKVFAHAIGINDISIPHLAEYAQYDFWKQIQKIGYEFVNDGPSWRSSLEVFKQKFRPIGKKRYYYVTLQL